MKKEDQNEESQKTPGVIDVDVKPTATLEIKVTRADGTVEYHNVPAEVEFEEKD